MAISAGGMAAPARSLENFIIKYLFLFGGESPRHAVPEPLCREMQRILVCLNNFVMALPADGEI